MIFCGGIFEELVFKLNILSDVLLTYELLAARLIEVPVICMLIVPGRVN